MKRLVLALVLLLLAAASGGALHVAGNRSASVVEAARSTWESQRQRLAERSVVRQTLIEQSRGLRQERQARRAAPAGLSPWTTLLAGDGQPDLSPEDREQLLADLGLGWHSSDEWLVVNKSTLAEVHMSAFKGNRLTDATCGVLAITPEERDRINAGLASVSEQYVHWAKANVQREGASGELVAKYILPRDPALEQSLTNSLNTLWYETLGAERAALLSAYASDWLQLEAGRRGGSSSTLSLSRRDNGQGETQWMYRLERRGPFGSLGEGPATLSPVSHFPGEFRAVFPGGWPELAKAEGMALPGEVEASRSE